MPNIQSFNDWQDADHLANLAQAAISALIKGGTQPSDAQLDHLDRLRTDASLKLKSMVADMKTRVPARDH